MFIVEWAISNLVHMAIAPLASFFLSIMIPSSVVLAFLIYRCACRGGVPSNSTSNNNNNTGSFQGSKIRSSRSSSSSWSLKDYYFMFFILMFTAIWIYAQCLLLQHLHQAKINKQKAAKDAEKLCFDTSGHPGRKTIFIKEGCDKAETALEVDPLGGAVLQWVDLFFSFSIFPSDDLGVNVPFGITRFAFLAIVITFMRESITPTVTWVKSGVNRLRMGPTSAGAA